MSKNNKQKNDTVDTDNNQNTQKPSDNLTKLTTLYNAVCMASNLYNLGKQIAYYKVSKQFIVCHKNTYRTDFKEEATVKGSGQCMTFEQDFLGTIFLDIVSYGILPILRGNQQKLEYITVCGLSQQQANNLYSECLKNKTKNCMNIDDINEFIDSQNLKIKTLQSTDKSIGSYDSLYIEAENKKN